MVCKSKYFFKDHGKEIDKEVEEYDSYEEKIKIDQDKCKHRNLRFTGQELRCSCGAAWIGPKQVLIEIMESLTKN